MTLLIWFFLFFILTIALVTALAVYIFFTKLFNDSFFIVNRNNTLSHFKTSLRNKEYIIINREDLYPIDNELVGRTDKGKRMYIVSEDNYIDALQFNHKLNTWVSSKTALKILNDRHIQEVIDPSVSGKELLMIIGAICAIVGCIASVVILLIVLQVIKVGIAVVPKVAGG